jgi:uncharacterized membrane protein
MKKKVMAFVCAVLLCSILIPQSASAASLGGYEITGYDVKAVISENNVYDITETINVRFDEERHGIYRDIPVNREMTRISPNGEHITTLVSSSVSDVNIEGWDYTVQDDGEIVSIKIGSPDRFVTGGQTYRISYKLRLGDDGADSFDEVYYNIIGTGWDSTIDNVTFSITLPEEFDKSKLGFSTGGQGNSGYDTTKLTYTVDGNTISGRMEHLDPLRGYYDAGRAA